MPQDDVARLLWSPSPAPQRGRPARISRVDLVAAGIRIADRDGLDAVSMQRVASEVGVTKMALYRHVAGRAELVALMVDEAIGSPPGGETGTWREGVTAWALAMHRVFATHRWLLEVTVGPRVLGPNEMGWFEAGLHVLDVLPLDAIEQLDTMTTVNSHVRGIALQQTEPASRRALARIQADVLAEHSGRYPLTAAALRESTRSDRPGDGQDVDSLHFGLTRILDGIDVLIASRRQARASS